MNKSDLEFYFKENMILSFDSFIISLVVASILSFVVQLFYLKFSTSLSNRLDFSKNFVDTEWANEIHFQPTTYYTHVDGVQAVDHIARYENFSEETQYIFKTVGINYRSEDFNHQFRKTNRDKDYRKYYKDDKTIENVSKHFSKDLETFGDKF